MQLKTITEDDVTFKFSVYDHKLTVSCTLNVKEFSPSLSHLVSETCFQKIEGITEPQFNLKVAEMKKNCLQLLQVKMNLSFFAVKDFLQNEDGTDLAID